MVGNWTKIPSPDEPERPSTWRDTLASVLAILCIVVILGAGAFFFLWYSFFMTP